MAPDRGRLDSAAFGSLLRLFGSLKALAQGKKVHAEILRSGIKPVVFLGNLLVEMYGKCGAMKDASEFFDVIVDKNIFSWTIMISAYDQYGQSEKALHVYKQMLLEHGKPDRISFAAGLKACCNLGAFSEGMLIHACILEQAMESDVLLANALVSMYGICGRLDDAVLIFEKITQKNIVSWNSMIAVFANYGLGNCTLKLMQLMQQEGICPDHLTFITSLNAYSDVTCITEGKLIHGHAIKCGHELDVPVANAFISMYARCSSVLNASKVFSRLQNRNVITWSAMVGAYALHGQKDAFFIFQEMQQEGLKPDKVTFITVLNACSNLVAFSVGKLVHGCIMKSKIDLDTTINNVLLNMYDKCDSLEDVFSTFNSMVQRDVISYTSIIAVYSRNGESKVVHHVLEEMSSKRVKLNGITFTTVLDWCCTIAKGKLVHAHVLNDGFGSDPTVLISLMNMYGRFGSINDVECSFRNMYEDDIVTRTTLLASYGNNIDAFRQFQNMQQEGMKLDEVSFISMLDSCTSLIALTKAKMLHASIITDFSEPDTSMANALINMYAKCGCLDGASIIFDHMPAQDWISWNTVISVYAQHSNCHDTIQLFQVMQKASLKPNKVAMVGVLFVCSHGGLVNEGWQYFVSITETYTLLPATEHYGCMVDLLGRAGWLSEAKDFILLTELENCALLWEGFLGT